MSSDLLKDLTIPLFSGAIGYITNWSGVVMLFYPIKFWGMKVPGLSFIAKLLPRRVQEVPIGLDRGCFGWQGIVPSRAAKMGSIAVDNGIAKLGTVGEFYQQLEPEKISEQILLSAQKDIRDLVERIMEREQGQLWRDLPPRMREAVHARVQQQLPEIIRSVTDEIGNNIDQLLDVKLMVIRRIEEHPELANRIFLDIGRKELKFIQNFGFFFGFLCGIPVVFLLHVLPHWWVLPIAGVIIGYVTNWLGIAMIFEPASPRKLGPIKIHGLFMRRQPEVADVYSKIIADDIVTISNIGRELLEGPSADRTRQMLTTAMRPAVDRAMGPARAAVRVAMGRREYDAIRDSVASESVEYSITPMSDPEFNAQQSDHVRTLISARLRVMAPDDFAEMLRGAIKQDEWLLFLHGAVLGFGAGCIHLAIFGV